MSEIYKRSLGQTFNERALQIELAAGVAGYDTEPAETAVRPLDTVAVADYRMSEELADVEVEFLIAQEQMAAIALEHPMHSMRAYRVLSEHLEALEADGRPVDAVMPLEHNQLIDTIISDNPDKDPEELVAVLERMVEVARAHYRLARVALAA